MNQDHQDFPELARRAREAHETYRQEKTATAELWQDQVQDLLHDRGLVIGAYTSRDYQLTRGENRAGVEIKHDERYHQTGNLFIETAEKADPTKPEFVASGIFRNDNSWLYAIGNDLPDNRLLEKLYVFVKTDLARLYAARDADGQPKYTRKQNATNTGRGFLLPLADAAQWAALILPEVDLQQEQAPAYPSDRNTETHPKQPELTDEPEEQPDLLDQPETRPLETESINNQLQEAKCWVEHQQELF